MNESDTTDSAETVATSDPPFPIMDSSPAMIEGATIRQQGLQARRIPFDSLHVGKSVQIPLAYSEVALRALVARRNDSDKPKSYRLIRWGGCYELGRVK